MNSAESKNNLRRLPNSPGRSVNLSVLALAILLGGMQPLSVLAQDGSVEQIEQFIERNAELLERAQEVVTETESVPARRVLRQAFQLHQKSLALLAEDRPLGALAVARRARAAMWRAVGLARESLSYEERLRLRVDRFRDQHAHLLEVARESNDRQALEFIHRAESQARRAREQLLQGDAKRAYKMFEQAEQLLHRAARLLANGAGPDRLDRELDRTEALIDQTHEMLGDDADPAALNLLAEADEALDRAREFRDQGQPGRALQMTGLARKLAGRSRALETGLPEAEAVRQQIERFDERVMVVSERVEDSGSEPARRHLDLAIQHRQRAEEALTADEVERALRQIRAAHDQLGQAEGLTR